jgi:hypothetical protein
MKEELEKASQQLNTNYGKDSPQDQLTDEQIKQGQQKIIEKLGRIKQLTEDFEEMVQETYSSDKEKLQEIMQKHYVSALMTYAIEIQLATPIKNILRENPTTSKFSERIVFKAANSIAEKIMTETSLVKTDKKSDLDRLKNKINSYFLNIGTIENEKNISCAIKDEQIEKLITSIKIILEENSKKLKQFNDKISPAIISVAKTIGCDNKTAAFYLAMLVKFAEFIKCLKIKYFGRTEVDAADITYVLQKVLIKTEKLPLPLTHAYNLAKLIENVEIEDGKFSYQGQENNIRLGKEFIKDFLNHDNFLEGQLRGLTRIDFEHRQVIFQEWANSALENKWTTLVELITDNGKKKIYSCSLSELIDQHPNTNIKEEFKHDCIRKLTIGETIKLGDIEQFETFFGEDSFIKEACNNNPALQEKTKKSLEQLLNTHQKILALDNFIQEKLGQKSLPQETHKRLRQMRDKLYSLIIKYDLPAPCDNKIISKHTPITLELLKDIDQAQKEIETLEQQSSKNITLETTDDSFHTPCCRLLQQKIKILVGYLALTSNNLCDNITFLYQLKNAIPATVTHTLAKLIASYTENKQLPQQESERIRVVLEQIEKTTANSAQKEQAAEMFFNIYFMATKKMLDQQYNKVYGKELEKYETAIKNFPNCIGNFPTDSKYQKYKKYFRAALPFNAYLNAKAWVLPFPGDITPKERENLRILLQFKYPNENTSTSPIDATSDYYELLKKQYQSKCEEIEQNPQIQSTEERNRQKQQFAKMFMYLVEIPRAKNTDDPDLEAQKYKEIATYFVLHYCGATTLKGLTQLPLEQFSQAFCFLALESLYNVGNTPRVHQQLFKEMIATFILAYFGDVDAPIKNIENELLKTLERRLHKLTTSETTDKQLKQQSSSTAPTPIDKFKTILNLLSILNTIEQLFSITPPSHSNNIIINNNHYDTLRNLKGQLISELLLPIQKGDIAQIFALLELFIKHGDSKETAYVLTYINDYLKNILSLKTQDSPIKNDYPELDKIVAPDKWLIIMQFATTVLKQKLNLDIESKNTENDKKNIITFRLLNKILKHWLEIENTLPGRKKNSTVENDLVAIVINLINSWIKNDLTQQQENMLTIDFTSTVNTLLNQIPKIAEIVWSTKLSGQDELITQVKNVRINLDNFMSHCSVLLQQQYEVEMKKIDAEKDEKDSGQRLRQILQLLGMLVDIQQHYKTCLTSNEYCIQTLVDAYKKIHNQTIKLQQQIHSTIYSAICQGDILTNIKIINEQPLVSLTFLNNIAVQRTKEKNENVRESLKFLLNDITIPQLLNSQGGIASTIFHMLKDKFIKQLHNTKKVDDLKKEEVDKLIDDFKVEVDKLIEILQQLFLLNNRVTTPSEKPIPTVYLNIFSTISTIIAKINNFDIDKTHPLSIYKTCLVKVEKYLLKGDGDSITDATILNQFNKFIREEMNLSRCNIAKCKFDDDGMQNLREYIAKTLKIIDDCQESQALSETEQDFLQHITIPILQLGDAVVGICESKAKNASTDALKNTPSFISLTQLLNSLNDGTIVSNLQGYSEKMRQKIVDNICPVLKKTTEAAKEMVEPSSPKKSSEEMGDSSYFNIINNVRNGIGRFFHFSYNPSKRLEKNTSLPSLSINSNVGDNRPLSAPVSSPPTDSIKIVSSPKSPKNKGNNRNVDSNVNSVNVNNSINLSSSDYIFAMDPQKKSDNRNDGNKNSDKDEHVITNNSK